MPMLNLLAISYHNIGPFKDQTIQSFFEQGNYLIKAPIGTGKSFLFLMGNLCALQKFHEEYSQYSVKNRGDQTAFRSRWAMLLHHQDPQAREE